MLIVMKNGNVELFSQSLLDLETTRRRDVFEIDSTEHGRDRFYRAHNLVWIFRVETDRKGIDAREFFEQHRLPFHHRQGCCWSNVAESENGCSISHDCDRVLLDRKRENFFRIFRDCLADASDARSVSH